MDITDELRDWAGQHKGWHLFDLQLNAIADRIDRAHDHAVMSAMNDALYHANDKSMAELGWVRLPLDADGVPIQLGDYLESDEYGGKQFPCRGLNVEVCTSGKRWTVCMSYDSYSGTSEYTSANRCHHVKSPTVEDVLAEFADRVCNSGHQWGLDAADTIAEYAVKLKLVEGRAHDGV